MAKILRSRREDTKLPTLDLQEYCSIVQSFPPPTCRQIEDFASYVAGAKSWYKHLPLLPPGVPFTFYVDPWAGVDKVLEPGGRAVCVIRTEETPGFHHSWMPTEEYRSRFGRLAFACPAGSQQFLPAFGRLQDGGEFHGILNNNPCRVSVNVTEERECRLPPEVIEVGMTRLTGVIHKHALAAAPWMRLLRRESVKLSWPEETGGDKTIHRIVERCRTLENEGGHRSRPDDELAQIIEPERSRLHQARVQAIKRVVHLLYGAGSRQ